MHGLDESAPRRRRHEGRSSSACEHVRAVEARPAGGQVPGGRHAREGAEVAVEVRLVVVAAVECGVDW